MWAIRENKRKIILFATAAVIGLVILTVPAYFITEAIKAGKVETNIVSVLKDDKHDYIDYYTNGEVYRRDNNSKAKDILIRYSSNVPIKSSPTVTDKERLENKYDYFEGTRIIDPVSYGLVEETPFTYYGNVKESSAYMNEMFKEGWEIRYASCDQQYCDYKLFMSEEEVRIIVSHNYFKIYKN